MDAKFPLFVFEKDDGSMRLIETPQRLLYHLEAIDIENNEYVFWDSGMRVTAKNGEIDRIARCDQSMSLSDALKTYIRSHGLDVSLEGPPIDIWKRIQSQIPKRLLAKPDGC
jgi:hypothetical protein